MSDYHMSPLVLDANPNGDCVDLCGLFDPEDEGWFYTTVEDMPCSQSVFGPLDHLQYAMRAAGDGQTSKKSPAKQQAPTKKATAVKRTANKPTAEKPPASLAQAIGVVQAPGVFPKLARGGGNMTGVKSSTRKVKEFRVNINDDDVALWEPNTRNAAAITILKKAIETLPRDAKTCDGTVHPLLHVSTVCIPMSLSNDIDKMMYPKRKAGNKAFRQLLTYLGMRSNIDKKTQMRTLTFDPDGWNRMGYRLVRGGDTKGGKPQIVYVR
jgi:hypothetical protein